MDIIQNYQDLIDQNGNPTDNIRGPVNPKIIELKHIDSPIDPKANYSVVTDVIGTTEFDRNYEMFHVEKNKITVSLCRMIVSVDRNIQYINQTIDRINKSVDNIDQEIDEAEKKVLKGLADLESEPLGSEQYFELEKMIEKERKHIIELEAKKNIVAGLDIKFHAETESQICSLTEQRHALFKARNLIGRVILTDQNLHHEANYRYDDLFVASSDKDQKESDPHEVYGSWDQIRDHMYNSTGFAAEMTPRFIENDETLGHDSA